MLAAWTLERHESNKGGRVDNRENQREHIPRKTVMCFMCGSREGDLNSDPTDRAESQNPKRKANTAPTSRRAFSRSTGTWTPMPTRGAAASTLGGKSRPGAAERPRRYAWRRIERTGR